MSPSVTGEAHPPQTELSCAGHAGILSVTKPRLRWGCSTAESWCFSVTWSSRPGETVSRLRVVWSTFFNAAQLYSMTRFIDTGSGCGRCRGGCGGCRGGCKSCRGSAGGCPQGGAGTGAALDLVGWPPGRAGNSASSGRKKTQLGGWAGFLLFWCYSR